MRGRSLIICAFALALSLPAGAEGKSKRKGKGKLKEAYTTEEVAAVYGKLADQVRLSEEKRKELKDLVEVTMARDWFKKAAKMKPVRGVFLYSSGEGGFIVKYMNGDGYAAFKGSKEGGKIHLKAWSAGAQIGGKASWGVGLLMGLNKVSHFGGDYTGSVKGATAGDSATRGAVILSKSGKRAHDLALITVGRGLSAGVGGASLTITPGW